MFYFVFVFLELENTVELIGEHRHHSEYNVLNEIMTFKLAKLLYPTIM